MTAARPLTLDDISDLRAYEREREEFRRKIVALKKVRRVNVGPVVTLTFECRETVRFQVQEMARAERMVSDEQVRRELEVYNRLLPGRGELSATLFLELVDEDALRTWLPRLVGIEHACRLRIGEGGDVLVVPSRPEGSHEAALTREGVTAAVHYVRFDVGRSAMEAFTAGPVVLAVDHPGYAEGLPGTELRAETRRELAADFADD